MKKIMILIVILLSAVCFLKGQMNGSITGRVSESDTKRLLDNVQVFIPELHRGANTNDVGGYFLADIAPGVYTVNFQRIGYQGQIRTDIVVQPNKTSFLNIELKRLIVSIEGVTVRDDALFETDDADGSNVVSFSKEEIRRAPGSAGDVSRIIMSLPGVAKVNDQSNNLIVRGGNPFENTFYIDGIEVPNINHFPHQGGSGGPIGLLNIDLINDVSFYTGGFSAIYGDKLSSIMDISLREGNRLNFAGQVEFSMVGIGGVVEGPLPADKGSWLLSVRRSYLDYIIDWFDAGTSVAPIYNDVQLKTSYDINTRHKVSLIGIWADDHNSPDRDNAIENQMSHYGNQDLYQGTLGLSWRAIISNRTFTRTAFSYTGMRFEENWYEISTQKYGVRNESFEQNWNFRNTTQTQVNDYYSLQYGLDFKYIKHNYNNLYGESTNFSGDLIPEFVLEDKLSAVKSGIFVSNSINILPRLTVNLGIRTDFFDYNENFTISPRMSANYTLNNKTTIRGALGVFHQNLPLLLLSQNPDNRKMNDPRAIHGLIGIDRLVGEDTKVTVELYEKRYDRFPLDKTQAALFVIDGEMFEHYGSLTDKGKALSRGIEFIMQKKLLDKIYGLASATYFRSQYQGLDGIWKNRGYDNIFSVSIEGGYKPNHLRDFSIRWIYAGGVPYTPFDIELSKQLNRAVYDADRINEERYPDYHSLNIRYDQRVFFHKTALTFYLSIWNVYDRKNIAGYYWNNEKQQPEVMYQWRILPVIGIQYAF